ncbi:MAG: hypothetical protein SGBAC_007841 [Bacillariaceae sp.]
MTEIDLNEEDQERQADASMIIDNDIEDMEGYCTYSNMGNLTAVPYADPQEESSVIKRPSPEPFGRRAMWALFLANLASVFGMLAGLLTELSNQSNLLHERENAIFFAQMLGGISVAMSVTAVRLLARAAREYQFKRLSRGRPMYQRAAWVSFIFGIFYSSGLLIASFLWDSTTSGFVCVVVPINFLPFILMMIHSEAARKN